MRGAEAVVQQLHVHVPMRDGVRLAANVFLPADARAAAGDSGADAIRQRRANHSQLSGLRGHGYAVVVQDVRGRYDSEGAFDRCGRRPGWRRYVELDRAATLVGRQDRHDGRIVSRDRAVEGGVLNNPHLKAIFPVVSGYDDYRDRFYSPGGAMKLGNRLLWISENLRAPGYHPDFGKYVLHLPLRTSDVAATGWAPGCTAISLAHPAFDSFWRAMSVREQIEKIQGPGLFRGRLVRQLCGERPGRLRSLAQNVGPESDRGGPVAA